MDREGERWGQKENREMEKVGENGRKNKMIKMKGLKYSRHKH